MAMLEVANRMQSTILRTVHASFSDEIQLLFQALDPTVHDDESIKIIPVIEPRNDNLPLILGVEIPFMERSRINPRT